MTDETAKVKSWRGPLVTCTAVEWVSSVDGRPSFRAKFAGDHPDGPVFSIPVKSQGQFEVGMEYRLVVEEARGFYGSPFGR